MKLLPRSFLTTIRVSAREWGCDCLIGQGADLLYHSRRSLIPDLPALQAKSDPTGLLQLAMKTRENVRLLEERISAFPLGLSRTVGATPASPAAPPARVAAPVPSQAQVVRSAVRPRPPTSPDRAYAICLARFPRRRCPFAEHVSPLPTPPPPAGLQLAHSLLRHRPAAHERRRGQTEGRRAQRRL